MSGFSEQWLALREPVDHRSRSARARGCLVARLAALQCPRVLDIGSGSGSNLRALAPFLGPRQSWRLVDHDPLLLAAARQNLADWAESSHATSGGILTLEKSGATIDVSFEQADLAAGVGALLDAGRDLVTAAAFFDLVGEDWIARFCADLVARKIPLFAALTYDGRETWRPPHAADAAMLAAFHAHQSADKGFGPAAGPRAHGLLASRFKAAGWRVEADESDWMLGAADAALVSALAEGSAGAATETGLIDAKTIADWLASRRRAETCVVGHMDLFAAPYF